MGKYYYVLRLDTGNGRYRKILLVKQAVLRTVKDSPSVGARFIRNAVRVTPFLVTPHA